MTGDRTDRVGKVIGQRFRLDALIGKGAMAQVYRALDLHTSAYVAIKILRVAIDHDPAARQRFAREAEVQERIRHHNVAALLGTGVTENDEPFLAVELLHGKTLRDVIKASRTSDERVAPRRAASYAWQALQGLAAVHAAGVVHRDLKPANIMLEPSPGPVERVVLIDFGFAAVEGSAKLTQAGTVVGSLTYMAPERLRGEAIDQRSDLYAMGVILYELLVGAPPFVGTDDYDLVDKHLGEPPPPLGDAFPGPLDELIQVALAKEPEDRYASAPDMAAALEAAVRTLS